MRCRPCREFRPVLQHNRQLSKGRLLDTGLSPEQFRNQGFNRLDNNIYNTFTLPISPKTLPGTTLPRG